MLNTPDNSNQSSAPSEVHWTEMVGKLKGFDCTVNGRKWGSVMRARNSSIGEGWLSSMAGMHGGLEAAKEAHLAAVAKVRANASKPVEAKPVVAKDSMSAEEFCRMRGKVYVDHRLQRLKRLDTCRGITY